MPAPADNTQSGLLIAARQPPIPCARPSVALFVDAI
jgi:hypothetical protein